VGISNASLHLADVVRQTSSIISTPLVLISALGLPHPPVAIPNSAQG